MVTKRQCSFCAREIEPGTGTMFVKRDGTVYQFCSSSCRKQQLHLGRIGHRFKWTRAYALKKAAERSSAERGTTTAASRPPRPSPAKAPEATPEIAGGPSRPVEASAAPEPTPAVGTPSPTSAAKKPRGKAPAKPGGKAGTKPAAKPVATSGAEE